MESRDVMRAARGLLPLVLIVPVAARMISSRGEFGAWPFFVLGIMILGVVFPIAKRLSNGRVEERIGLGISRSHSAASTARQDRHVDDIMSTYDPQSDSGE